MWRRLWAICRKEWIQIRRDPRTLAVVWALPITHLLLYGYAMDFDLKDIRIAVVDHDRSHASRRLIWDLDRSEYFVVWERTDQEARAEELVLRAEVREAIIIPAGFEKALRRGVAAPVQVLLDGSDPTSGGTAFGYTQGLVEHLIETGLAGGQRGAGQPPVVVQTRVLYNPALRSTRFIVPGLMAVLLTMLAALLTSNAVVREKERGTFEALIATPVRPIELMVGKLLPYVVLASAQVAVVIVVGWVAFGVVPQGSLALLAVLSLIFLLAALGIGLLISTAAHTQQLALMAAIMATVIPSQLLSGFAFPLRNMPAVLRLLSNCFPATHYLVIVRGVYLKGVGLDVLWKPAVILAGFAILTLAACARRFHKQL